MAIIRDVPGTLVRDERTEAEWEKQTCLCGKSEWCGRDRHRPNFAVDETNSTIFFDKNGNVTEDDVDGIIKIKLTDLINLSKPKE
jgi:hypothetical protein